MLRLVEITNQINQSTEINQQAKDIWAWAVRGDYPDQMVFRLTLRQQQIMEVMSSGKHDGSNKAIARELKISASTVKAHFALICSKFGLMSRTQAVAWYMRATGELNEELEMIAACRPASPVSGGTIGYRRKRKK